MKKKHLLNFPITLGKYGEIVDEIIALTKRPTSSMVCVANVHMFVEAYKDPKFLKIVKEAEIVTADGKPLTWALQMLYGIKQDRVAGMDLLPDLLQKMSHENLSAYFYGGSQSLLDKTKTFLEKNYPALNVSGLYSPPFHALSEEEKKAAIDRINEAAPKIIFVILGCPKQEKWMASVKDKVHAVMIGIGGALPVMLGIQRRAPRWMQKNGLEWLYRLRQEPQRLFGRYHQTNRIFIWLMLKQLVKKRIVNPMRGTKEITTD